MLTNLTKKTLISKNIISAKGLVDNIFGMILSKNSNGLILKTNFGIHTFLMRDTIDVLILDNKNRVVKIKKSLKPNRIFVWNPKYGKVVELPEGSVEKSKTEIGDDISL